jgi:hypothetical protein
MLTSPGVAGLRAHRGEVVATGTWTSILDRATWQRVVDRFAATKGKPGRPPEHLLSGLLRCGRCGGRMLWAHHLDRKRGLPDRHQYACRKREGTRNCGRMVVSAEPVEEVVGAEVLAHLDPDTLRRHLASLDDGRAAAAASELADAETALLELSDDYYQRHLIGKAVFLRQQAALTDQADRARRVLGKLTGRSTLTDLPTDPAELAAWWSSATVAERREVVAASLDRVVIHPSGPRMSKFDAGRVEIPPESWKL